MTPLEKCLDSKGGLDYEAAMKLGKEFAAIQKKEKELAKRRADLERDMTTLVQEESELAITKRTMAKLLGIELEAMPERPSHKGRGKPRDIPSVYDMAVALFREMGQEWLETQEIVRLIKERWWPSAEGNDIAPTLWRLQKDKKLRKSGTKYALPQPQK